ncbi:aldehyde dehydrogenase [Paenibacillus oenotherae]|uniref:Aldehyde dehydrogenase n=2 Tax=Paenibacillus oenotherae TaxID=1435645 RepID=A0ABS7D7M2_9BACL|nr:aldehyde dehydrogenase [Paenibacillus oenotherae]MBW7475841.1 aldehyde dehydrogenase [Paenibacillus oenotherae]
MALGIVRSQQEYVQSGSTRSVDYRLKQLELLKAAIKQHEALLIEAMHKDLRKSEFEAYATEIGFVYESIRYISKHLKKWAKVKLVRTPLVHWGSKSYIYPEPYGSVLVIGPYNYPFMIVMEPLIGAIAAGNCAVVKPSEFTPHISAAITAILRANFKEHYIAVVEGGREATSALIHTPFDYIFFTGSIGVGRIVMEAAAKNLVPVTLELGGKSPCIVDRDSDIELAAHRIIWGKFLNAGQTCVAPDYILVHKDIKESLVARMKDKITAFYGDNPQNSADFGRIVNERHWERLVGLLDLDKIAAGGDSQRDDLYIAPTIMDDVTWDDKVMEEEIFGPILPVLAYDNLDAAIQRINGRSKPLALYVFTTNKDTEQQVLERVSFGGGCVNDTMIHLTSPHLPFGGVGASGTGSYHGRKSFETFSHMKSVLKKRTKINWSFIYPPYSLKKIKLIRKVMK